MVSWNASLFFKKKCLPLKKGAELLPKNKFNPSDYFGIWSNKNIDVDNVSKEMRDEWDRGF